jgi:hypothetical protein
MTLFANDPESSKYIITKNNVVIGGVAEVRHNEVNSNNNGLVYIHSPELDTTPFTLKKRPVDDYSDENLELIFTNEA